MRSRRPRAPRARGLHAAPPAHHLTRVLAGVERAASADGRQVPRPVWRRAPGHGRHAAQQLAGGEPQLAAAHLLHLTPPSRRLVPGPAALFPEPPPLCAQPACRALWQEPAGADDRPGPSALAHPAGPGTAPAPADLTWGGRPPPALGTSNVDIRPTQAGALLAPVRPENGRF